VEAVADASIFFYSDRFSGTRAAQVGVVAALAVVVSEAAAVEVLAGLAVEAVTPAEAEPEEVGDAVH
jgi:hypothetical protein